MTLNETELLNLTCTLGCECSGAGLEWRTADGSPLPANAVVARSDSMQSLFLIVALTRAQDAGDYVCVATFGSQAVNKTVEVVIDSSGKFGIHRKLYVVQVFCVFMRYCICRYSDSATH